MISDVVADVHLFNLAIFRQLDKEIFINVVKIFLDLGLGQIAAGIMRGVMVDIGNEDGLREVGLDVFTRTAISMSTSTDFEVEGAVDPGVSRKVQRGTWKGEERTKVRKTKKKDGHH